ncbi:type IV pilus biogenesis protein PilM [Microbacterium sulfonylureivorans]|uniref:type IV pilus biogenesis protein PilM n=1 Tax=Microbacterium sulfonylureivorans TaxID=2486854 RepID=UPI000FDC6762|nr:pilus assembly protein PilM [Microbacterium sulfonylureivorans]
MGKTIVGLELTEESVRAAEITVSRNPQVIACGEVPLPPDAAKDSEVLDSGTVAVALRQLWTGARFKSRDVVLGVASRRILVREYTTQAMRPDLLREALPYQVQDLLPVPASQAVLDFFPLGQDGDRVSGLLVAAVSETVEQIIATLGKVKLRARGVDLTAFGLARATARLSDPGQTVATVFIGDHTTQVVVSRGGVPQFVRILPLDVPTMASLRQSPVTMDAVAVLESSLELVPPTTRARSGLRAAASHHPIVSDLAARVRSTLAFFAGRPGAAPIEQVFVTGAGVSVPGVMETLTTVIDAPLRSVSVEEIVGVRAVQTTGDLALNLVSTVGIALGEVR